MAIQLRTPKLRKQLVLIARKPLARMKKLVEPANERLIQIAHPANNGVEAVLHLFGVPFFQVVIDQNDHRQRETLVREHIDSLLHIVFKNTNLVLPEIWN